MRPRISPFHDKTARRLGYSGLAVSNALLADGVQSSPVGNDFIAAVDALWAWKNLTRPHEKGAFHFSAGCDEIQIILLPFSSLLDNPSV